MRPHGRQGADPDQRPRSATSSPRASPPTSCGTPTLVVARTDAESAKLITSDVDERDGPSSCRTSRTPEGFYHLKDGTAWSTASRAAWPTRPTPTACGGRPRTPTSTTPSSSPKPIQQQFPGKLLAYNCSPSFNWEAKLDEDTIAKFQRELGAMGYKFQFVTLAGFHSLNHGMFELAQGYRDRGMAAYSELQQAEFASEAAGYTATRHQREVGTGYFDQVAMTISGGASSTTALSDSTEAAQFAKEAA